MVGLPLSSVLSPLLRRGERKKIRGSTVSVRMSCSTAEIAAELLKLDEETENLLREVVKG